MTNDSAPSRTSRAAARRSVQRARVLAAAREHFLCSGYSAATMSAIAADVGGSKGVLWSYFASKDELFATFVDEETRDFHRLALAILAEGKESFDTLRDFAVQYMASMASPDALSLQRLAGTTPKQIPIGGLIYGRLVGVVEAALMSFYARGMATGSLRPGDPLLAASVTVALCIGPDQTRLVWGAAPAIAADVETRANKILDILTGLYAVKQSR